MNTLSFIEIEQRLLAVLEITDRYMTDYVGLVTNNDLGLTQRHQRIYRIYRVYTCKGKKQFSLSLLRSHSLFIGLSETAD